MSMRQKHSEVLAHTNRVVRRTYEICHVYILHCIFILQDEDSGDSDNEAEEQRKVCLLSPRHVYALLHFVHNMYNCVVVSIL